jgi:hypothetical protein
VPPASELLAGAETTIFPELTELLNPVGVVKIETVGEFAPGVYEIGEPLTNVLTEAPPAEIVTAAVQAIGVETPLAL